MNVQVIGNEVYFVTSDYSLAKVDVDRLRAALDAKDELALKESEQPVCSFVSSIVFDAGTQTIFVLQSNGNIRESKSDERHSFEE